MQEKNILTVIPMNAKHQELLKKTAQNSKIIFSDPEKITQDQVDQAVLDAIYQGKQEEPA